MTMATTVAAIRRLLDDNPDETTLSAAISSAAATTVTVTDISKFKVGQTWEFDDGATGAEDILINGVTDSTSTITMKRGHKGSTAATHSNACVVLKEPRYRYDVVAQAVNYVLDVDLFHEGLFDIQEHQVTSSATSDYYNSPAAGCRRFLDVYQKTASMTEPRRSALQYTPLPTNADTTLFANGKYFVIQGNYGTPGTGIYYVSCAHDFAITTLTTAGQRIVEWLGAAYLLEWGEIRRIGGPNNQGDETVKPGIALSIAAQYRARAEEAMAKERHKIAETYPNLPRFMRYG